mmetsp:Transcript_8159/g.22543  ORF Transcript_8159/g.22543 Transcript_8159/m.22543 type:complete len:221 (+) Transcript_8159:421-1083(+)
MFFRRSTDIVRFRLPHLNILVRLCRDGLLLLLHRHFQEILQRAANQLASRVHTIMQLTSGGHPTQTTRVAHEIPNRCRPLVGKYSTCLQRFLLTRRLRPEVRADSDTVTFVVIQNMSSELGGVATFGGELRGALIKDETVHHGVEFCLRHLSGIQDWRVRSLEGIDGLLWMLVEGLGHLNRVSLPRVYHLCPTRHLLGVGTGTTALDSIVESERNGHRRF